MGRFWVVKLTMGVKSLSVERRACVTGRGAKSEFGRVNCEEGNILKSEVGLPAVPDLSSPYWRNESLPRPVKFRCPKALSIDGISGSNFGDPFPCELYAGERRRLEKVR